jgi:molecular chaperone DnaK
VLYASEKALKEHGGKVPQEERVAIERAVADLKDALKSEDTEKISRAKDELLKASQKLGEIIYKEAAEKSAAGKGGANGDKKSDKEKDVVDAEVVEEDKKD